MRLTRLTPGGLAAVSLAGLLATNGGAVAANPSLSGFWIQAGRKAAAPPALTRAGAAAKARLKTRGDGDVEQVRWCVPQGLPYVMDNAGPIDILVGPREVVVQAEKVALPRHIYTAGQKRPDMASFDQTPVGYSSGRWEGGDLVVETVGLSGGVGPVGAPRTPSSHVTERFHVAGDALAVTTTWSDRKTFARPYRYTQAYRRAPADYTAEEFYCDPRDNGVGHASPLLQAAPQSK